MGVVGRGPDSPTRSTLRSAERPPGRIAATDRGEVPISGSVGGSERGFSLIELMVVLVVIGILIAIAVATFLGARTRAADRAAEANLRTAMLAAFVQYTHDQSFAGVTPGSLRTIEPSLAFNSFGAGGAIQGEISVRDASDSSLLLVTRSGSGATASIAETTTVGYGKVTSGDSYSTAAQCVGGW